MKNSTDIDPAKFAEWFRDLPDEEKRKGSLIQLKQAEDDWTKFADCFERGFCSICEKPIKTFSMKTPCLHWLLKPKGFKKKHADSSSKCNSLWWFGVTHLHPE